MFDSDEVSDILARAVKAVDDAKVPPDLKAAAFERAIDLLTRGAPAGLPAAEGRAVVALEQGSQGPLSHPTSASTAMDRLATRLRLSPDVVERVYTENGDALAITVDPDKLARSRSAGARDVALLVTAAAQASTDEATSVEAIRRACEEYDKFDSPNFAATLAAMKGTFLISGPPRARTFKLTRPGWVAAATLIGRLGGADRAVA
jgi:hypothetical protein